MVLLLSVARPSVDCDKMPQGLPQGMLVQPATPPTVPLGESTVLLLMTLVDMEVAPLVVQPEQT